MKLKLYMFLMLGFLYLLTPAISSAVFINFDDVSNGTIIDTHYPGVTFSCVGAACESGNHIYARTFLSFGSPTAETSPNNVSSHSLSSDRFGEIDSGGLTTIIKATFSAPVSLASIDANTQIPVEPFDTHGKAFLSAFDAGGNPLGTVLGTKESTYETLSFTTSANLISFVEFSSTPGSGGIGFPTSAIFDNLNFNSSAVPEPSTWLLLGSGLAGLVIWRRYTAKPGSRTWLLPLIWPGQ